MSVAFVGEQKQIGQQNSEMGWEVWIGCLGLGGVVCAWLDAAAAVVAAVVVVVVAVVVVVDGVVVTATAADDAADDDEEPVVVDVIITRFLFVAGGEGKISIGWLDLTGETRSITSSKVADSGWRW